MRSYFIKPIKAHLVILAILVPTMLAAQDTGVSPYSRFGLGDPSPNIFTSHFGMGGLSTGVVDNALINMNNPATLPFLLTPGFEVGGIGGQETVSNRTQSVTNGFGRLDHFALAMPFARRKWGLAMGLQPYSTLNYDLSEDTFVPVQDVTQTSQYSGSGGLNRMQISLAHRILLRNDTIKNGWNDSWLSLSASMNYLFGTTELKRSSIFPANSGFLNSRIENNTTINSIKSSASFVFRTWPNKKVDDNDHTYQTLDIGGTAFFGGDIKAVRSQEAFSYTGTTGQVEFFRDSINSFDDRKGTVTLPSSYSIGAAMEFHYRTKADTSRSDRGRKHRKLRLGLEYRIANWQEFRSDFDGVNDQSTLTNSSTVIFGLEYTPAEILRRDADIPPLKSATYRVGARYSDSHIIIDDEQITEYGISFGASFPVLTNGRNRTDTKLSIGGEFGQRGTTDNGLIKEEFFRAMVGLTFHPDWKFDRWFQRRKYD